MSKLTTKAHQILITSPDSYKLFFKGKQIENDLLKIWDIKKNVW